MRKLRRAAAVAVVAATASIAWPGAIAPASAHQISCYLPGDLSQFGSYMECQVRTQVHKVEHLVP